jgi:hypothetical protein
MSYSRQSQTTVGRSEEVAFTELGLPAVPARIDTGAKTSALWGSAVEHDGALYVVLFAPSYYLYTGEALRFGHYSRVAVAPSSGEVQVRYKVRLLVTMRGRKIRASFTLADRSTQAYPVLIGRNVLRGKYIVDVEHGLVANEAERARRLLLRAAREKVEREENI